MSTRDLALRALVTKCIADLAATAIKARRADLADEIANGDRIGVTSPDDPALKVGMVYRTDPDGKATITNPSLFTDWMRLHYPDRTPTIPTIMDSRLDEALLVLRQHAPHLLTETPTVLDWAVAEVLKLTEQARRACGPGGELDVPGVEYKPPAPGVVTVKLSEDGPAIVEQLWRAGRIDLTTGEVLALPAGES